MNRTHVPKWFKRDKKYCGLENKPAKLTVFRCFPEAFVHIYCQAVYWSSTQFREYKYDYVHLLWKLWMWLKTCDQTTFG